MTQGIFDDLVASALRIDLGANNPNVYPTIIAGFGVPTAVEATGSVYYRRDAPNAGLMLYVRAVGAWWPVSATANSEISVATEAALTAFDVTGLPEGQLAYVQSHRSYWALRTQALALVAHEIIASSDPANTKQWTREVSMQHWSWTQQIAWGIDVVAGNDENVGSVASPLQTWAEFRRRTVFIIGSGTMQITGNLPNTDEMQWDPVLLRSAGVQPTWTVTGVTTLGTNRIVVGANTTAQAGNQAALLDAGFAFSPGDVVQATSGALNGATTVIQSLVAGTQFRTVKWRTAAGSVTAAVPANADTVAVLTLPTVARACFTSLKLTYTIVNFDFTVIDPRPCVAVNWNVCRMPGTISSGGTWFASGCSVVASAGPDEIANASPAFKTYTACGFVGSFTTFRALTGGTIALVSCVISQTHATAQAFEVIRGGTGILSDVGLFSTGTGALIDCHENGFIDANGTPLYGTSTTPAFGTRVRDGGVMLVIGNLTPTLTTTAGGGKELDVDTLGAANALPSLLAGAAVPALAALATWANWAANPFNRTYHGLGTTAAAATSLSFGTRLTTYA